MARRKPESMSKTKTKRKSATVATAEAKCHSDQRLVSQPDIRERARAAGCWLNAGRSRRTGEVDKEQEMAAFMSVFHPEIKGKKLKALVG